MSVFQSLKEAINYIIIFYSLPICRSIYQSFLCRGEKVVFQFGFLVLKRPKKQENHKIWLFVFQIFYSCRSDFNNIELNWVGAPIFMQFLWFLGFENLKNEKSKQQKAIKTKTENTKKPKKQLFMLKKLVFCTPCSMQSLW